MIDLPPDLRGNDTNSETSKSTASSGDEIPVLKGTWSKELEDIAKWLTITKGPPHLTGKGFWNSKQRALRYRVDYGVLLLRLAKNAPERKVIDNPRHIQKILNRVHEQILLFNSICT